MKHNINGSSFKQNGWTYISVYGKPRERGYAYGLFCAEDFKKIQEMLNFFMLENFGYPWEKFIREIAHDFMDKSKKDFHEFYEEMVGIAEGCNAGGTKTSVEEILAWNYYMSIPYWMIKDGGGAKEGGGKAFERASTMILNREGGARDHCSAFIAVGDSWTADGGIVVAHNSFADYIDGQWMTVILDLKPEKGARFLMQTSPCWIWSGTDFFVTEYGILGTETTIGGFNQFENKIPIMYRIRKAMQYGRTMDDYVKFLVEGNSGDYANSWLFGDIKNNEILRIELGLKYYNVERTKNGYFIGFNGTYDPRIRNLECSNQGFYDLRRHQGARFVRLGDLMDRYKGKLNVELAKKIIADHYDPYLLKENNPCSRTVCSHYEEDPREYMSAPGRPVPFSPHGALDGCVADTNSIKNLGFYARYGRSCGQPFLVKPYIEKHRQYKIFEPYLLDRPSQPWTYFQCGQNGPIMKYTSSKNKSRRSVGGRFRSKRKRRMTRRRI
jgi:hypothetical protein